jgi:hypothetical protein
MSMGGRARRHHPVTKVNGLAEAEGSFDEWLERTPTECRDCGTELGLRMGESDTRLWMQTWCDVCAAPGSTYMVVVRPRAERRKRTDGADAPAAARPPASDRAPRWELP